MRFFIVLLLLVPSMSFADEFGGWKFKAPAGTRQAQGDVVQFTRISGNTFCQYGLFSARAPSGGDEDLAQEWQNVVARNFTAENVSQPVKGKTKNLEYVTLSATLVQKDKGSFVGTLYIIAPLHGNAIGSLLVTSSTSATLAKCATKELLDSIVLATVPAATTAPAPAATTTSSAPAAQPADSIVGGWGGASGNPAARSGTGDTRRWFYTFNADGTYTYFSEAYNGVNEWIHVRESGKYSISGNQLTIAPTTSTISSRDWNAVKSTKKNALEKVTYAFEKHYFSGIQEWNLVLTPAKPTDRDGPFSTADGFKSSYLLNTRKPQFKWP